MEINEVDTWIFTSRIFRLALEITFFYLTSVFFPTNGLLVTLIK